MSNENFGLLFCAALFIWISAYALGLAHGKEQERNRKDATPGADAKEGGRE